MNDKFPYLATENLAIGYRSKGLPKTISDKLNLKLWPGNLVCLLGSNGSGKSTLMRTLAGLQPALAGEIYVKQQSLSDIKPEHLARQLSLVLTERVEVGNLTALETINLGRTPYTGWLGRLDNTDKEKIEQAVYFTDVSALLDKRIHQLSDGERQKVMLARALAQDTDIILLDEPTAHLDLPNRIEMMDLLHTLARKTKKAILLSTHELDLALQTADHLWLLKHDGQLVTGVPEDLVLNGSFESAFSKEGFSFDKTSGTFSIRKAPGFLSLYLEGDENLVLWTKRAVKREGWEISLTPNTQNQIRTIEENGMPVWELLNSQEALKLTSIEALLHHLESKTSI
ncbi:ABC transporter ATP-binding protein [Dyadobacter arcticus]|uniref:Iron complex transport system ATP-binding protein n=1 Tax=Dyadobacter arcticus TaxID=1078754 RepID=A0ABX0UTS3_9BACT|nr:ABC transporter ATP-binding protein [Dyadobacter arcticus]NIJ55314.1 iron complex transport system ATP-binding protein [Dyadobacter arcticus]